MYYIKSNAYANVLSFVTLERYVACLGDKVFMFPGRIFFGGFFMEDEQRLKLGAAHTRIPFLSEKCMTGGRSTLLKVFLHYVILIFRTVLPTQRQTYNWYNSL